MQIIMSCKCIFAFGSNVEEEKNRSKMRRTFGTFSVRNKEKRTKKKRTTTEPHHLLCILFVIFFQSINSPENTFSVFLFRLKFTVLQMCPWLSSFNERALFFLFVSFGIAHIIPCQVCVYSIVYPFAVPKNISNSKCLETQKKSEEAKNEKQTALWFNAPFFFWHFLFEHGLRHRTLACMCICHR